VKKTPRLPIAKPSDDRPPWDHKFSKPKTWGSYVPEPIPKANDPWLNASCTWTAPEGTISKIEMVPNSSAVPSLVVQEIIEKHKKGEILPNEERRDFYVEDQLEVFAVQQDRFEDHDTNQFVELIGKASDYEGGWFGVWPEELEIGHVFRFFGLNGSRGVKVISCENFRTYFLPYFVLETIKEYRHL
jgi:hypothetical protein